MKKSLIFLLFIVLAFSCCLFGCSNNGSTNNQGGAISGGETTVNVTGISLDNKTAILTVGSETTLIATVSPTNATNKNVSFSSSDNSIATVDTTGKIKGIKAGIATITVSTADGNFTATCTVTVENLIISVTGVKLNMSKATLTVGSDITLKATVSPTNATNKNVSFSSSDSSIVTVDANGKIVGVKKGTATITCKTADGNHTATCNVTVKASSGSLPNI